VTRLQQIRQRQDAIRARLLEIEQTPEPGADADEAARTAFTALTPETDTLLAEWDTLDAEAKPLQERADRMAAVHAAAADDANRTSGFGAPQVMRQTTADDAFANLDGVRAGLVPAEALRSRALTAIEKAPARGVSDAAKDEAYKLVESHGAGVARHALLTGSPAYRSAFEKALENPMHFQAFLTPEESEAMRTALSTTAGNGGYAIPFLLDPTVILTNAGAANPFRQICRTVRGVSNIWHGVTSSGVTAEWKSEGAEAADASPTVTQPAITAYQADAYVFGSYEIFEDTNLAADLPRLIADAKDRLEATAFATGSGSGQPKGVVTAVAAVTASRVSPTTGGTFTAASSADVFSVMNKLTPRHRPFASWVGNYSAYSTIRQMSPLSQGSAFWVNMGAAVPNELIGRPVYEASAMDSTFTTGSNILLAGNFEQYVIFDRIGMTLEYIPNVIGSNQRPTAQRGWFAVWRTGGDCTDAGAFRVLQL
jgi:HK97 family phage major capsid protein